MAKHKKNDPTKHEAPSDDDLALYRDMMNEVRDRSQFALDQLHLIAEAPDWNFFYLVESAALQLRRSLETVAMSSLVANRAVLDQVKGKFGTTQAKQALQIVSAVNPRFWPNQVLPLTMGLGGQVLSGKLGEPLSKEGFYKAFNYTSELLHAQNPYEVPEKTDVDMEKDVHTLVQWLKQLAQLLKMHTVVLPNQSFVIMAKLTKDLRDFDVRLQVQTS